MNGQLKLSAEQVITAIQLLSPEEKSEVRRLLPALFDLPDYAILPEAGTEEARAEQGELSSREYSFSKVRKLLRDVQGNLSAHVISEREDSVT